MKMFVMAFCVTLLFGCGSPESQRRRGGKSGTSRQAPRREMISPGGGYVVAAETPSRKKPQRELVITRSGGESDLLRFPFTRQVDVVWAPDERAVAIVDLVMENETRVVAFRLPGGEQALDLRREHVCKLNRDLPCGVAYARVYFSNVIWLAPDQIQVTVDMIDPLERNLPPQIRATLIAPLAP